MVSASYIETPVSNVELPTSLSDFKATGRPSVEAVVSADIPGNTAASGSAAAYALIAEACTQAEGLAARAEARVLRRHLQQQRAANTLQRANAEQARRVADCLRSFQENLIDCMAQPCFLINRDNQVTRWNPALACWSGASASWATGKVFSDIFCPETARWLQTATREAFAYAEIGPASANDPAFATESALPVFPGREGAQIALLPLFRIPSHVEAVLVLLTPQHWLNR